jgi:predicted ATPase/DNA-binding SARP family transcriptional activator
MQIALLGPLAVRDHAGTPVDVGGRRVRTLLTVLALRAGQVVGSTHLIDRIWGDDPPETAPNALQALVSRLRRSLPPGLVESHPTGYRLAVDPDAVDVHRFERLVSDAGAALGPDPHRAAAALAEALALWRGPPLAEAAEAGFTPGEIARLDELRMTAVEDLAAVSLRLGDGRAVVVDLEALVAGHPTRERAAGLLMRALVAAGRGGDALAAYERTRHALADRLGADPSPDLAALHRRLLRGEPDPPPARTTTGNGAEPPRTNLKAGLTSFVGRDEDVTRVGKLATEFRLTTLTGPGGAGKTRLAIESARTLLGQLPDGVWLVELAPLTDAAELPKAVLTVLGLREQAMLPSARRITPPEQWARQLDALEQHLDAMSRALSATDARLSGPGPDRVRAADAFPGADATIAATGTPGRKADLTGAPPAGAASAGTHPPGAEATEPGQGLDPVDRVVGALSGKRLLLVLDNCEHLVDAAAALVDRLLGECPQLRILATSREPLGITGETLWPVEPLALPPAGASASQAASYAAVRLLADRAAAVRPGFAVDDRTVGAVVRICRALDGLPLAIELAAARLRTMTAEQLADRLDHHVRSWRDLETRPPADGPGARFRLLNAGSRTALPRHRTLQAVVDWSWELLSDPERRVLRRLAWFVGGATLSAAERVCAGDGVRPDQVLDLLAALVDKSLVAACDVGEPRYELLETIREYGLARLADAGETDLIRRRHAEYFVALARTAEPRLRTGDQLRWLSRLSDEHENLHAAVRGAIDAGEAATAVRLTAALGWYWWLGGHKREGVELAAEALAMPAAAPATLSTAGPASMPEVADPDVPSRPANPTTPAAAQPTSTPEVVDPEVLALAYVGAALNAIDGVHDEAQASAWFQAATALAATTGQAHPLLRLVGPISRLLKTWAWGAEPSVDEGDPQAGPDHPPPERDQPPTDAGRSQAQPAGSDHPGSLDSLIEDPDPWVRGTARLMRGHAALNTGRNHHQAEHDFETALADFRRTGDRWGIAFTLSSVADLAAWRADFAAAAAHLEEAITLLGEFGTNEDLVQVHAQLAQQYWLLGNRERAEAELANARRDADRIGLAECYIGLDHVAGELARLTGERTLARTLLTAAWEQATQLSVPPQFAAVVASTLGLLDAADGDLAAARARHGEALRQALTSTDAPVIARTLVGIADLALAEGDPHRAAELLGASVAVRGTEDRSLVDAGRVAAAARDAIGERLFAEAFARGRTLVPSLQSVRALAELELPGSLPVD